MLVPHDMHMELPKYDRWDNGTQSAWFEQKRVFRFHFVHGIFMLNIDLSLSMAIIFVFIMYHDFIFRYYITMTFYCHVKKGYVKVYRQVFARLMTISFFFSFLYGICILEENVFVTSWHGIKIYFMYL